jgi:hypothetical protein
MENLNKVDKVKTYLKKEFGIKNEKELKAALKNSRLNIGIFVQPIQGQKEKYLC